MKAATSAAMTTLAAQAPAVDDLKPWVRRFVRLGYAGKGVIYLLIGGLALRLALGAGGQLTDSTGVLKTVEDLPLGVAWLLAIAVGLLAYAGWKIAEGVWDAGRRTSGSASWMHRALVILKGLVYGTIGIQAIREAGGLGGDPRDADEYARSAMQFPFGGVAFGLIGLGIASYGLFQIWEAWNERLGDDLDRPQMYRDGCRWMIKLGRAGVAARGVILVLIGGALARAGLGGDPAKAGGMTEALWAVFAQPYGTWLLAAVAAGLMCYGLFQVLHARYARL